MHPETKKQQTVSLFTSWSKIYDWRIFQFWFKRFYMPAVQTIDHRNNFVLLDVSCGTGEFLHAVHKKAPHAVLHGTDITPDMVARATQKLKPYAQIQQADVHALPFGSMYDYVVSTESFHHYYSQEEAIKEMVRVAKHGGKVIVVDINFFFPFFHRLTEKFEPGCVKVNSKRDMRYLFHHAGLKDIKQRRNFLFAVMTIGTR